MILLKLTNAESPKEYDLYFFAEHITCMIPQDDNRTLIYTDGKPTYNLVRESSDDIISQIRRGGIL